MGTDIYLYAEVKQHDRWVRSKVEIPDDRNYWAFAVLADVRNGEGFAGCDLGDPVTPIAQPRGLPADTSTGGWLGDYSHSWVTLAELLAVDLDQPVIQRMMVSTEAAARYRATGVLPDEWSAWTSHEGHELIQIETPLREAAWLLPKLIQALSELGKPEDVRLVFGFAA